MRILVIQLKRIGDVLLTTPLLAAVRETPCHVTLVLDASTASLAPALDADHTLVFRRGTGGFGFWKELAAGRFDVVLDLTGNDRSALMSAVSRAPKRVTWQRFAAKPLRRFAYTDFVDSSVRERHTADHHTDLLRALDIEVEGVPMRLKIPEKFRREAEADGDFAVVHPGTARAEKYWLPERWAEAIDFLETKKGLPVLVTGSDAPDEREHLRAITALRPVRSLAGKLSLLGTAAVIERARIVCAVDSAPVHLADALGTPVVALFGPTNPFHWRPRRSDSIVVRPPEAGEIRQKDKGRSMAEIQVADVCAALDRLLDRQA